MGGSQRLMCRYTILLAVTLSFLHCTTPPPVTPPDSSFTLTKERKALFTVDSTGGEFCSKLGICLRFPPGAVPSKIEFFGWRSDATGIATVPNLHLEAELESFAKDIEIELPVGLGQADKSLLVAFQQGNVWKSVLTKVGKSGATRIGTTNHLSIWNIVAQTNCQNGTCSSGSGCNAPKTNCGGNCVDLQTSTTHCGACQNKCSPPQTCQSGTCQTTQAPCTTGKTDCSGTCVDLQSDPTNCGQCAGTCKAGESCDKGQCKVVQACPAGQQKCAGVCVDLQSSIQHCGTCGMACKAGESCQKGVCQRPSVTKSCHGVMCGGKCVFQDKDVKHCGACNKACAAGEFCCDGVCTKSSNKHCGRCNNKCLSHHTCQQGQCKRRPDFCPPGRMVCNFRCVDLKSNVLHCGACGNKCPNNVLCTNGKCSGARVVTCGTKTCPGPFEYTYCNSEKECRQCADRTMNCTNKGCLLIYRDKENCGGCGLRCPNGLECYEQKCAEPRVASNQSRITRLVCDGAMLPIYGRDPDDPTKQHGLGPVAHCADCYQQCKSGETCYPLGTSPSGFGCASKNPKQDCNGTMVTLQSDPGHCGACNNACKASEHCKEGKCVAGAPKPTDPMQYCQGSWVNTTIDALNCGSCGKKCAEGQPCAHGKCLDCGFGKIRCQGKCIPITKANCYTCGSKGCLGCSHDARQCQCSLNREIASCKGSCVNILRDPQNCGGCGSKCPATDKCTQGKCVNVCQQGQTYCGRGCIDTKTSAQHCGSCDNACSPGQTCTNGTCQ